MTTIGATSIDLPLERFSTNQPKPGCWTRLIRAICRIFKACQEWVYNHSQPWQRDIVRVIITGGFSLVGSGIGGDPNIRKRWHLSPAGASWVGGVSGAIGNILSTVWVLETIASGIFKTIVASIDSLKGENAEMRTQLAAQRALIAEQAESIRQLQATVTQLQEQKQGLSNPAPLLNT